MSDPAASEANVPAAVDALTRAIEHLEAAVVERERTTREEARRLEEMRREAEALRALQHKVAQRLDAAIARLKETIGD